MSYPDTKKITPDPLRREPGAPTAPPIDALGPLAPVVKEVAHATQAPPALVMQSFLAATTLAVQAHADVEIDGRVFPLSENFFTIAESGERKTAVDQIATKPHHEFQREQLEIYEDELARYQKDKHKYQHQKKQNTSLAAPIPPRYPLMLVQEPSYEGLIELLKTGWPSVGLFTDEGGRFIGGHAMRPEQRLKTMAGLSELWSGTGISRVRVGKRIDMIYDRRFSCHLMVQPEVAWEFLGDRLLMTQGLLGRFLICYPQSTMGHRSYQAVNVSRLPRVNDYHERIMHFLRKKLPYQNKLKDSLLPRPLGLTANAYVCWREYYNTIEKQIGEDRLRVIRPFISKATEHVARLAGVLTLYGAPDATAISEGRITQGIMLVDFYLKEAIRLMEQGKADEGTNLMTAEKCLAWVKGLSAETYPKGVFATCDLYQRGPSEVRTAEQARRYLWQLARHGWIKRLSGTVTTHGQLRREGWQRLIDC